MLWYWGELAGMSTPGKIANWLQRFPPVNNLFRHWLKNSQELQKCDSQSLSEHFNLLEMFFVSVYRKKEKPMRARVIFNKTGE